MENQKFLNCGVGPLFMDPDPDKAREFFKTKSRALTDKIISIKEAVTYYGKR
jgi:glutaconate CoA-transferase subunit A